MSADLVTWLRGCIDDDERAAVEAGESSRPEADNCPWVTRPDADDAGLVHVFGEHPTLIKARPIATDLVEDVAVHIARWDPARVLAEVAAKRAILKLHEDAGASQGYTENGYGYIDHCCETCGSFGEYGSPFPCATLRALVEPYRGRAGFDPSWLD